MSDFELDENDLRMDVYANAQHGAVRHVEIRHLPTGLTARASDLIEIKARREALADLTEQVRRRQSEQG